MSEPATDPATPPSTSLLRGLARRPAAVCAAAFLVVLAIVCVAAPLFAPYSPNAQDLTRVLTAPTAHNLLGTDTLGRDVLSRLIYGGRRSLLSMTEGWAVVLVVGAPLGLAAGYLGGWVDALLDRFAEVMMAMPALVLVLVVLSILPQNEDAAMVTFGLLGAPSMFRVVRSATIKAREELFVSAARIAGASPAKIISRHLLPRVKGPIIVQITLFAAYALLFESGISYLGLTSNPSTPTWGGMVAEASTVLQQQSWLLFPPGVLIMLVILAFGVLGDAVRDVAVMDIAAPRQLARKLKVPRRARARAAAVSVSAPPETDALLSVSDLSVAAAGPDPATLVDHISFEIRAGETVGLVGESGCGKSLTALALMALLPTGLKVTGGSVSFDGRDVLRLPERELAKLRGTNFAYVSQEPQASLDPVFAVGSQLGEVVRRHDGVSRRDAKARVLELLRQVEIRDPARVARARPFELSGGMAQRVAIALALAGHPRLLIADEPTTALDVTVQADILELLRRLQRQTGMAILLITHNWGVVADICTRTLVMYAGQVVEEAAVQDVVDAPLHPYSLGLLCAHPAFAVAGEPMTALKGAVPPAGAWPEGCRFAPRCDFAADDCTHGAISLVAHGTSRAARCIHSNEIAKGLVST
jgi:peptide/nickel transport system permease protein